MCWCWELVWDIWGVAQWESSGQLKVCAWKRVGLFITTFGGSLERVLQSLNLALTSQPSGFLDQNVIICSCTCSCHCHLPLCDRAERTPKGWADASTIPLNLWLCALRYPFFGISSLPQAFCYSVWSWLLLLASGHTNPLEGVTWHPFLG